MANEQSIESLVRDHFAHKLRELGVPYRFDGEKTGNKTVDDALRNFESKSGGKGDNRPDIKFNIFHNGRLIPVMIEVKGTRGKLEKLDKNNDIELVTIYAKDSKQRPDGTYTYRAGDKNYSAIEGYAVNGAIHYANALLTDKNIKEVISIGVNGYGLTPTGHIANLECNAYYVSKKNGNKPRLITEITAIDWDLLAPKNINKLLEILNKLNLTPEEYEELVFKAEADLDVKIHRIHQRIYDDKSIALGVTGKMYLFCGLIMAGLSADDLTPLDVNDLKGSMNKGDTDSDKVMRQINNFLTKRNCPDEKKNLIITNLKSAFDDERLSRPTEGESAVKSIYKQIKDEIIPCLEGPLHLDFMGRIFNKLGDWMHLEQDHKNDVVLTPRYITTFMAKLCRINKDKFVWDRTMGSGGFLVTAMDLMIKDAQETIHDEEKLNAKIKDIKGKQLFGIELLPQVFMLASLNMILMGDGSSNLALGDAHDKTLGANFPANVFLLNPPYSASGCGFVFVEEALSMMTNGGYAAILIQENAGSGQGLPYTKNILKNNTLIATIKMADIFSGKATVPTAIYVFEIGKPHDTDNIVKFIDMTNDGYKRQNRKKSSQEVNLKDTDHAKERYAEVEAIILGKKPKTNYYTKENGTYIEDTISLNGNDWTFAQHKKIDTTPTEEDFKKTMRDYLLWKVSSQIKPEHKDYFDMVVKDNKT